MFLSIAMERKDKATGLVTMCTAGGMAPALNIERVKKMMVRLFDGCIHHVGTIKQSSHLTI